MIAFTQRANAASNSQIAHLELAYSPDALGSAPRHVPLKTNLPESCALIDWLLVTVIVRADGASKYYWWIKMA